MYSVNCSQILLKSVHRGVSNSRLFVSFLAWHKTLFAQVLGLLKETGDSTTQTLLYGLLLLNNTCSFV